MSYLYMNDKNDFLFFKENNCSGMIKVWVLVFVLLFDVVWGFNKIRENILF